MKALWFFINLSFVAVVIAMLFSQRALTEARSGGEDEKTSRLKRLRNLLVLLSILLFAAMSVSFIANMKMNG